MSDQEEHNLSWLQDFYQDKIQPLQTGRPEFITDGEILKLSGVLNNSKSTRKDFIQGRLTISTIPPRGWSISFLCPGTFDGHDYLREIAMFLYGEDRPFDYEPEWKICPSSKWTIVRRGLNTSIHSVTHSYFNIILEAFRCWVEGQIFVVNDDDSSLLSIRSELAAKNSLLTWLDDFYISCCDGVWECYSYSISNTGTGWVAAFPVEDLLGLEDKPFEPIVIKEPEGTVECYVKQAVFIIRAHHRGLITGISMFKNWIES